MAILTLNHPPPQQRAWRSKQGLRQQKSGQISPQLAFTKAGVIYSQALAETARIG